MRDGWDYPSLEKRYVRPTPLGKDVSLLSPSPAFHGREGSNCRQEWDLPTGHRGADTQGVGHLFCRGREKEQRGVVFLKSLPRALGTGVRREGGSAETSGSGRELLLPLEDLCERATSVLKQ